jgi:hypothetical protein
MMSVTGLVPAGKITCLHANGLVPAGYITFLHANGFVPAGYITFLHAAGLVPAGVVLVAMETCNRSGIGCYKCPHITAVGSAGY